MRASVTVACALLAWCLATPALAVSPDVPPEDYFREAWTRAEGLHQNSAFALARTPDGYLWIGNEAGLERFDGVRFTLFRREAIGTPDLVPCEHLDVDARGHLWLLLRDGHLVEFESGRGLLHTWSIAELGLGKSLGSNASWLQIDASGQVWARWGTSGILRVVGNRLEPLGIAPLPVTDRTTVVQRRDGSVLVGTHAGLRQMQGHDLIALAHIDAACPGPVAALFEDHARRLWLGLEGGDICRVEGREVRHFTASPGPHRAEHGIRGFHEDDQGTIWVPTPQGVTRIRGDRAEPVGLGTGRSDALDVLTDPEGSLWVGTYVDGLVRLRDSALLTLDADVGVPANLSVVLPSPDGGLWLGTFDGRIVRWRERAEQTFDQADGQPLGQIWTLALATDGALWAGTGQGLFTLRDGSLHAAAVDVFPRGIRVLRVFAHGDGSIWANTGAASWRILGDSRLRLEDAEHGFLSDFLVMPSDVSPGASEVWGRNDSAAFVVQPGQPARPLRDDHGVPLPPVRHWSADGKTVWLFTIGGKLGRFRSGRLAWLDRGQGVPEIRAHVLQVGPDRSLWMTANDGLFRATIADLDAALDGRETHVSFSTYGTGDGLRSSEFNGGVPAGALDTQGRLWFPNAAGAVRVDPRRFRVNAVPPPVRIEAARVTDTLGEHDLPTQTGLTLQPGSQQLAIDYTAPSFLAPSRVQFAYQLEGMDARPVAAQTRRTAYYTGLQPGRHAFRVWATNADGIRSVHAALLDVTVLPAWYQTRAFTVACVLAVLALFWTIYTVRLRQLRARQRDLEGQVRARTADLEREKAVSESLLLNVLPASIAHRLKEGETTIADTFEEVSVLFADIVGFTVLSADSTPQAIVELLNDLFSRFDAVTERFGVEKIKTIGDAYMVVAGVPLPRADHAGTLADVALAMLDELNDFNGERGATLALRIGLHSGPVVAGVIGKRKFSYDLWGDTVNTASRMESHGVVGCIHLSEATRDRLPSRHGLEDRGLISIKGKGSMRTFLLTSGGGSTRVGAGLYVTAAGMAEPSGSLETLRSSLPSD